MCLAACYWANIRVVVYACSAEDAEGLGYSDRRILKEIQNSPGDRSLVMQCLSREEGIEVFEEWKRRKEKE